MTDRLIAMQLLTGISASTNVVCSMAISAHNPDLKRLYEDYLKDDQAGVKALEQYVIDQGWLKPYDSPEEQLKLAIENAEALISVTSRP